MPWISLMDRSAQDRAPIESAHEVLHGGRRPVFLRQSGVEVRFLGDHLVRTRRIHRSERQRAREWRSLFQYWRHGRGKRDDLMRDNELAQLVADVPEGVQKLVGRGM